MTSHSFLVRRALGAALAAAALVAAAPPAAQAAGAWAPVTRLAEGSTSDPGGVAIAPDGTVTAVFARHGAEPFSKHVVAAVKPPGGVFGPPQRLSDNVGYSPRVASDDEGNVAVVWNEQVAGANVVVGATRPAGGAFSPAQRISDTGSDARYQQVEMAGGHAVVAWAQGGRVRAASAEAGTPFTVHDPITANIGFSNAPFVGVAPDGAAVVTWAQKNGTGERIAAAARPAPGGAFAPLADVATLPTFVFSSRVVMSPEGRATLAWSYWDDAAKRYVLQSASRGRSGEFGGVETVDTHPPSTNAGYLALDVGPDGTALLFWSDVRQRYALKPEGGGFGATHTVTGSHTPAYLPKVKFGGDGTAFAVWRTWELPRKSVEYTRISLDGSSSGVGVIGVPGTQAGTSDYFEAPLGLDADAHGNAAVSWYRSADVAPGPATQTTRASEVRIFDTTPPVLSDVQVPATALTGRPVPMSATATDTLTPVTIRWSFGKFLSAQGPSVFHTYATPGRYGVGLEVSDAAGNARSESRFLQVDADLNPLPSCPEGQICE